MNNNNLGHTIHDNVIAQDIYTTVSSSSIYWNFQPAHFPIRYINLTAVYEGKELFIVRTLRSSALELLASTVCSSSFLPYTSNSPCNQSNQQFLQDPQGKTKKYQTYGRPITILLIHDFDSVRTIGVVQRPHRAMESFIDVETSSSSLSFLLFTSSQDITEDTVILPNAAQQQQHNIPHIYVLYIQ